MILKNQEDNIYEILDSCTLSLVVANQSNPIILPPLLIHTSWIGNLLKVGLCLGQKYASNFCVSKTQPQGTKQAFTEPWLEEKKNVFSSLKEMRLGCFPLWKNSLNFSLKQVEVA